MAHQPGTETTRVSDDDDAPFRLIAFRMIPHSLLSQLSQKVAARSSLILVVCANLRNYARPA